MCVYTHECVMFLLCAHPIRFSETIVYNTQYKDAFTHALVCNTNERQKKNDNEDEEEEHESKKRICFDSILLLQHN